MSSGFKHCDFLLFFNHFQHFAFNTLCFQLISQEINKQNIDYNKFKTINGNTQNSERISINIVKQCLDNLNYSYTEAHSQGSKDFRNICNIGLNIEVKKTDKYKIMFNDTLPSPNIYYIIMFTGKNFKHKRNKNIKPQIIFILYRFFLLRIFATFLNCIASRLINTLGGVSLFA